MLLATYIAVTLMTVVTWVSMVMVDSDSNWPLSREDRASYSTVAMLALLGWAILTVALIIKHWS